MSSPVRYPPIMWSGSRFRIRSSFHKSTTCMIVQIHLIYLIKLINEAINRERRDEEDDDKSGMSSVRWSVGTLVHGSKLSNTILFLAGPEFLQPPNEENNCSCPVGLLKLGVQK
ncbi:hypothetical protein BDV24DRAFT_135657 [Aspergillus arachidicola]|uniref:Uncharacterized protein n=1 Tax=Aspergillus arachidicola TaxID=656916 RepID=A0A5N6Y1Z1_9EURO|nr:hypothetical protein BDV24DRAFT_135657 [Aspergillus arachidicola]